jgi:hypothetical protein
MGKALVGALDTPATIDIQATYINEKERPMAYLTFPEFQATARPVDDLRLDIDTASQVDGDTPVPGIVYADGVGYLMGTGPFELVISNDGWHGDRETLEKILWAVHYLTEGVEGEALLRADDGTLDNYVQGVCAARRVEVDGDLWGQVFSGCDEIEEARAYDKMRATLQPKQRGQNLADLDRLQAEIDRLQSMIARINAIISEA